MKFLKKFQLKWTVLLYLCFCASSVSLCHAQTFPAILEWSGEVGFPESPGIIGWEFTTNEPIILTELGVYDDGDDGLLEDRNVTLWDSSGAILAEVSIPAGDSAVLEDGYRYQSVLPRVLPSNTGYLLADDYRDKIEQIRARAISFQTHGSVIWLGGRTNSSGSATIPLDPLPADQPGFSVSFRFTPIPEPACLGLFATALALVLGIARTPYLH